MGTAAGSVKSPTSPQVLIFDGLYMANLPWNNNLTVSKGIFALTAVIGTLLNGFVAAAILGHANRLTAHDISTAFKRDFGDFCQYVACLCLVLIILSVYGSRRIWLIGSGTLCLLTFACGLSRTESHHFILHSLIGLLVAILLATAVRLAYSCFSFGLVQKGILIYSGLILYIGSFLAWPFGIELAMVLSWKGSFFVITAIDVLLFTLSIIFLPPDQEWNILLEPFRMWGYDLWSIIASKWRL